VNDYQVFKIQDTLRPTATGLDRLPAWFLRLAAPVFCGPVADLINLTLMTSTVPAQWKQAYIRPVPKTPQQLTDYRPISITPVLCGATYTRRCRPRRQLCISTTSSPSAQPARLLRLSSIYSTPSSTCWKLNHTSSSYPWISLKLLILYGTPHFCINWLNFTFLMKSTTGWWTSLITIPTTLYSATKCHHCLASPPASSRGQPLDQPPMLSPPETSSLLCRETRHANSPMTRTSSSRPATRRPGIRSSPTCRNGPSVTT